MRKFSIALTACIAATIVFRAPVFAGPFEDGRVAYKKDDFATAVKLFHKAALNGHAQAQYALAIEYVRGKGVEKDFVLAYFWFNLAGASGDKDAWGLRDVIQKRMTRAQVKRAKKLVAEWTAKHKKSPK